MNFTDSKKPPCCNKETKVNIALNKLTPHIICIELIEYFLNNAPCQFDVKLSNNIYKHSSITPEKVVAEFPENH